VVRARTLLTTGILVFVLSAGPLPAGVVVVFKDGQTLAAAEARLEGDAYSVRLASGDLLTVPVSIVREIQIIGDARPAEPPAPSATEAVPLPPSNPPPPPPQPRPVLDPHWQPQSGFSALNDPNFKPAEWSKPAFDPNWQPTPAYDPNADVLADGRAEFAKPTIDPHWQPTDAFAGKEWKPTDSFAR
jgi:hypothetical protein